MKTSKETIQVIAVMAKSPAYSPAAVKALMKQLNMNERAFALLMNVTPRTVRLWITGAARPCSITRRLMQVYETGPEVIDRLISRTEGSQ